jgi:hypothetical protein
MTASILMRLYASPSFRFQRLDGNDLDTKIVVVLSDARGTASGRKDDDLELQLY